MKKFNVQSKIGSLGEALAKKYLVGKGHMVLAENYYFDKGKRSGEIDIITEYQGSLHFVEVKTKRVRDIMKKSPALFLPPESQVTRAKLLKCSKTAEHYLRSTRRQGQDYHFDVVAVVYDELNKKAAMRYFADTFY